MANDLLQILPDNIKTLIQLIDICTARCDSLALQQCRFGLLGGLRKMGTLKCEKEKRETEKCGK